MTRRLPVLLAIVVGLSSGLALSGPLSALISPAGESETPLGLSNPFAGWAEGSGEDLLVLGTDEGGGNTDVITLVRVEGGVTRVTQVPRDAYIESERWGPLKINALYSLGGVEEIKRELSDRLGRPVRHHLIVNLSSLRLLADQLGGIEVTVPQRMYYVDNSQGLMIDLYPGPQLLKGRELEGFLRFRHDELGDIGRMQRQRLVLSEVFRRLAQPAALAQLPSLLRIAGEDVRTDLSPIQLTQILAAMAHTRLDTSQLAGRPYWQDDLSYWMPETNQNHPTGEGDPPAL